ncbi:2-acylglycerol O-acyltransferase 2-like [Zophobas morio]|uniref:2-acylglycerol O-acyltransferase 2-like n=1 Tax=Zophobas morio TaxID=2755281 RepID=UPI0030834395
MATESYQFVPISQKIFEKLSTGIIFILYTQAPFSALAYLVWLYYDKDTPDLGGRTIPWIQNNKIWYYPKSYFPSKLALAPGFNLDPKRNYLFCFFPHGIIPNAVYIGLTSGVSDFQHLYPQFQVQLVILRILLFTPFWREVIMGMGLTSSTAKSLNYILSRPEGGRIVVLSPGGAMEAYYGRPQKYTFLIKERKGFIKMALRHGSPLVPVIAFGEPDLFEQVISEKLRPIQEFIRKYVGIAPVIFYGTGFLFRYGLVPRKVPLTCALGKPIEVEKVESPTNEEIDSLHAKFVQELKDLFDLHKDKFLEKPDDDSLVIM